MSEVFVGGSGGGAKLIQRCVLLWILLAGCSMGGAQATPPPPGSADQPQSNQGAGEQNANGSPSGAKDPAQNEPAKTDPTKTDPKKADPNQTDPAKGDQDPKDSSQQGTAKAAPGAAPEHQGVMETVNSTVDSTVQSMRRLPAQWFLGSYIPANQDLKPLTMVERRDVYIRQTYLTGASYLKRMFGAGVDQARGAPYEWGGGFGGYGKRFASRYGEFILQNSLAAAGNAWLGYEPRYDYCKCTGFWPRTKHAMARNFFTYNSTEIEKRAQIPLYVGAFSAGAIAAETWRPENDNAWKRGAYSAASQAGFGVLSNWLQEFALDIGHKITPKRRNRGATGLGPTNDPASPKNEP